MNKKAAETTMFNAIIGILIAVVLSLVLISLIGKFISDEGPKDESSNLFYFTKFVEDLTKTNSGEVKSSTLSLNKNLLLIAFDKNTDIIKQDDLDKSCFEYILNKEIEKPVICRDKNCLCLCKSTLVITRLSVDCLSDESKCIEIPLSVEPLNACKTFLFYKIDEDAYNLNLRKEDNSYSIIQAGSKGVSGSF